MSLEPVYLLATIAALISGLILRSFLPGYLAEKGKNAATKEDIAAITREVERVRVEYSRQLAELQHQNTLLLEELRNRNQLRLAAVERRLQAHQEAFSPWRKLNANVHSQEIKQIVVESQTGGTTPVCT